MSDPAEPRPPSYLGTLPTWLLSQANVRAHRILVSTLEQHDARGHHVRILVAVDEVGPTSQTELAGMCALDPGDVARAVDELEERGSLRRRADPADRRRKLVSLTAAGRRRLVTLQRALETAQSQVVAPLSVAERRQLVELLGKLQP